MKNKGFTLIELMGIIILLSLLSVLVVSAIDSTIRLVKEQAYNNQLQTIHLAARSWVSDNIYVNDYVTGDVITITLGQLKIGGYIEEDFYNTNTKALFADDMQINIVKNTKIFEYNILDTTGSQTGLTENAPLVFMNEKYVIKLPVGSVYTEYGINARTYAGVPITTYTTTIKQGGSTVGSVSTASPTTYIIEYSVTDSTITRTIFRTVVIYTP